MDIIEIKTKIKEKDKIDGKLTDEYIFQAESNFAKILMDFIKEGNTVRIKSFKGEEVNEEYVCSAEIVIKKLIDKKGRTVNVSDMNNRLILQGNKIILEKVKHSKNYDVVGIEPTGEVKQ